MVTMMVPVMETGVVVVMLTVQHLAVGMALPMMYWLFVEVERVAQQSRVLFLVLLVEPIAVELPVERMLEEPGHSVVKW
jgi:hypothetical protein